MLKGTSVWTQGLPIISLMAILLTVLQMIIVAAAVLTPGPWMDNGFAPSYVDSQRYYIHRPLLDHPTV